MDRENKPMGKVTESEKVADRLGSSKSERGGGVHISGNDSPGKGVVDKFKGAFTSWFGKETSNRRIMKCEDLELRNIAQDSPRTIKAEPYSPQRN
ncbi:hypothetical protein IFM89_003507 [Coptis chinensis]|uniref:Uncharacterized protein n=1 Tax=Coptis chinensis TaxID=261450 RepID=A0A835LI87_9MAGN|nr:hypothetical protein IFM89_003507 [Coptis chinensis]